MILRKNTGKGFDNMDPCHLMRGLCPRVLSNMASWENPAFNGGVHGKINELNAGSSSLGKHHDVPHISILPSKFLGATRGEKRNDEAVKIHGLFPKNSASSRLLSWPMYLKRSYLSFVKDMGRLIRLDTS